MKITDKENFLWRALPRKVADLAKKESQKWSIFDCFWPYFDVIGAPNRRRPATSRYVNKNIFENQKIAI